jgi:xylulokinase
VSDLTGPMDCIIAHDLGTTGDKACLVDRDFRILGTSFIAYPTYYGPKGEAEQNPEDWWQAVCGTTHELLEMTKIKPADVAVISFSGQMMGCLPVDRDGVPLRPAMIWADQRASGQASRLREAFGSDQNAYQLTGQKVLASFTAAKSLWFLENEPGLARRIYQFVQCKEYLVARLCGAFATEPSDASGTNLFHLREGRWLDEICAEIRLDVAYLPEIRSSTAVVGKILPAASVEIGLNEGTPVVLGGADGECAAVGAGAVSPGDAYLYLGSTGWLAGITTHPINDPKMRFSTEAHVVPGLFSPNGTTQNCGSPFAWLQGSLARISKKLSMVEMDNLAKESIPGAHGLLFLPYILGERSPFTDPTACGAFLGISQHSLPEDFFRAILEGVCFNFSLIKEGLHENGVRFDRLRAIGGGSRSQVWMQILSDVLDATIEVPPNTEITSALGAAACGGVGIGMWDNFGQLKSIDAQVIYHPDPDHSESYRQLVPLFEQAYHANYDIHARLSELGE